MSLPALRPTQASVADDQSPFGRFTPSARHRRLLEIAQRAPHNAFGKQLARAARGLYLWRAPVPADLTVGDIRMRCFLRDNTSERKFVFTPWRFDPLERGAMAECLPKDGTFVDVGANVGIYTLTAALLLGARGRVIAIEPYPPAFRRLMFNIEATRNGRADWPRIEALEIGVSNCEENRELRIDRGNLGGGSIATGTARFSAQGSEESMTIPCRPLGRILAERGIGHVDVMKIDIEGAEDVVLLPFVNEAAEAHLPRLLIVENSEHLWNSDLRGAIAARGYRQHARSRLNTIWVR